MGGVIRRLGPGDEARLAELCARFKQRVPGDEQAQRLLARDDVHVFAALEDGQVVGFAYWYVLPRIDGATGVFLYELEVAEAYRRRGLGRALVEEARRVAERAGATKMWVETDEENEPAKRTYASAGGSRAGDAIYFRWDFP